MGRLRNVQSSKTRVLSYCSANKIFCFATLPVGVAVVVFFFLFLKVPISQVKVCRTEKAKDLKKSNAPA